MVDTALLVVNPLLCVLEQLSLKIVFYEYSPDGYRSGHDIHGFMAKKYLLKIKNSPIDNISSIGSILLNFD